MTERSVTHATFVVERTYDASPARVFAAWADPRARVRWDVPGDDWEITEYNPDFRVGGRETVRFGPPGEPLYLADTRYEDIVPDARIISSGTMSRGKTRLSAGLLTVELLEEGSRTRLILTEQGAFLDGSGVPADHEQGWGKILDKLAAELRREPATP